MSYHSALSPGAVDDLLRSLPFDLDDTDAVAGAFAAWQQAPPDALRDRQRDVLRRWAYAFAHRYALRKLLRESRATALDLDALRDDIYDRIDAHLGTVREADRFPHWAHAVCVNTFRAWLRRRDALATGLPDDDLLADDSPLPDADAPTDPETVMRAVREAIESLPPSLRAVAEARMLFGRDYAAIAADTGTAAASLRVLHQKARQRLQADPRLRALWSGDG